MQLREAGTGRQAGARHGIRRRLLGWLAWPCRILSRVSNAAILTSGEAENVLLFGGGLESMDQGMALFNRDLRLSLCNPSFRDLLAMPGWICRPGTTIADVLEFRAERGDFGPGDAGRIVVDRRHMLQELRGELRETLELGGAAIDIRTRALADGGLMVQCTDITELLQTRAAANRGARAYRDVIDHFVQAMAILRDGEIIHANQAQADALGFGLDDLIGMGFGKLFHPDALPGERQRIMGGGAAVRNLDIRFRKQDGSDIWMTCNAADIDWRGHPARMIASLDVTRERLSATRVEASEHRLRTTLENIVEGVITIDGAGLIESFNKSAERIFDYTAHDVIGHNIAMLMPEPDRGRHDMYLRRYRKSGVATVIGVDREVLGRRRDGSVFPMEIGISEITVGGRRLFVGTFQDVSARRAAEGLLRRHAAVLSQMKDGVLVTGPRGCIAESNPAVAALFGYGADELLGEHAWILDANPKSWLHRRPEALGKMAENGHFSFEALLRRKDGTTFDGEVLIVPFDDHDGDNESTICVIRDISPRKESEAQSFRARKMETVGQLTGGLAHDLNNLLTIVLGNLELIEETLGTDSRRNLALTAIDATRRGATLIDCLLTYSRQQLLAPKPTDINGMVEDIGDLLAGSVGPEIRVETALAPNLWPALVDPGQLENAILNLAVNARDAMPGGGVLRIETANLSVDRLADENIPSLQAGDFVRLMFRDSGGGMTRDVAEQAFEPFFTTKETGQGSGLGLSMIYGFMKQSGGDVRIDSRVGEGTAIMLYLPRGPAAA